MQKPRKYMRILLAMVMVVTLLITMCPYHAYASNDIVTVTHGHISNIIFSNQKGNEYVDADTGKTYVFQQNKKEYELLFPDSMTNTALLNIYLTDKIDNLSNGKYAIDYENTKGTKGTLKAPTKISSKSISCGTTTQTLPTKIPLGTKLTIKVRVGEYDDDARDFKEGEYDEYTLTISRTPTLKTFKVSSEDIGYDAKDLARTSYAAKVDGDSVSLDLEAASGVEISVGGKPYSPEANEYELSDFEKGQSGEFEIPITLKKAKTAGTQFDVERTYTLHISQADYKPVITGQPEDITADKGALKPITVGAQLPDGDSIGSLEYQWYEVDGQITKIINGADSASYTPDKIYAGTYYYKCLVKNIRNGVSFETWSNTIAYTINKNKVTAPMFASEPVVYGNDGKKSFYQNVAPVISIDVFCDVNNSDQTVEGTTIDFEVYRNRTNDTSSGEKIGFTKSGTTVGSTKDGNYRRCVFTLEPQDVTGTYYYYIVAKVEDIAHGLGEDRRASEPIKLEFSSVKELLTGLEGSGSASDPFVLKSQADLEYVKGFVEGTAEGAGQGFNFFGQSFKFANDITLDKNWKPMGCLKKGTDEEALGVNILPFSGIIDGGGYTLRIASGGKPLIYYARRATVKNLNIFGEYIDGYGLVDGYTVDYGESGTYTNDTTLMRIIDIDNVTIKSGTKITQSGFIGGVASGANAINIRNCVVEKNVEIGYGGQNENVGSLAGSFNGTVTNCKSYATVSGKDRVGGLIGGKGQSMGPCDVKNSSFEGKVVASGECVGGIVGAGYLMASGTPVVQIHNCYVKGDITGKDKVGGILGSDAGHVGYNDTGDGYGIFGADAITDTHFTGTLKATGGKIVGGILGYVHDFTKTKGVATNYYLKGCGASSGIGGVITGKTVGEAKHSQAVPAEDFTNGILVNKLNNSTTSYKNWMQGDTCPILSDKAVALSLSLEANSIKQHYVGDDLDLSNIKIYVNWSDGRRTQIQLEDVELTGYDKNIHGLQTITVKYGAATATLNLTVLKKNAGNIHVSFTLLGDKIHRGSGEMHTLMKNNLEEWLAKTSYEVDANATVLDVIKQAAKEGGFTIVTNMGETYISAVRFNGVNLKELDNGANSGWMYTINGKHSNLSINDQYLDDGDEIILHYTDDFTQETQIGESTAEEVIALIEALPDVNKLTLDDAAAVAEAASAYNSLSDSERTKIPQKLKDKLEAAIIRIAELRKPSAPKYDDAYNSTGSYLGKNIGKGGITVGEVGGDWTAMGLARSGKMTETQKKAYYNNVVKFVKENANAKEQLHRAKSTENSRIILALTAAGFDPKNVAGHNLLAGLTDMDYLTYQGINGPIWALIAFDSHGYEIPEVAGGGKQVTRDGLIRYILNKQTKDGGWDLACKSADPDMTGMALQALAPYYKNNPEVKKAVDKALKKLSAMQLADGGYSSTFSGVNIESCAQVVVALTALGIDPDKDSRFVKNGNSVMDALMSYYVEGGGFCHVKGGKIDGMATEQGYYALTAYDRFLNGKNSLYDMRDVTLAAGGSGSNTSYNKDENDKNSGGNVTDKNDEDIKESGDKKVEKTDRPAAGNGIAPVTGRMTGRSITAKTGDEGKEKEETAGWKFTGDRYTPEQNVNTAVTGGGKGGSSINWLIIIIVLCVAAAVAVCVYVRGKRNAGRSQ